MRYPPQLAGLGPEGFADRRTADASEPRRGRGRQGHPGHQGHLGHSRHIRHLREMMFAMSDDAANAASGASGASEHHGHDHEHHDHVEGERGERSERSERSRGRGRGGRSRGERGFGFGGPGLGGPGGPGFGGPYGRGPRAGRGDIRNGVLALLAEQPRHGYEIIQELVDRSGGVWRASPGSIYPMLKHLAHEGLIRADKAEGRRVFELTDAGRSYVEAHADELAAPWDSVGSEVDDVHVELHDLTRQVAGAVMQVGEAGTPDQLAAAAALLAETRRSLYRILAEDPTPPADPAEPTDPSEPTEPTA